LRPKFSVYTKLEVLALKTTYKASLLVKDYHVSLQQIGVDLYYIVHFFGGLRVLARLRKRQPNA
jgi:hypothetical protein